MRTYTLRCHFLLFSRLACRVIWNAVVFLVTGEGGIASTGILAHVVSNETWRVGHVACSEVRANTIEDRRLSFADLRRRNAMKIVT
jgi:hypothetical protein